MLRDDRTEIVRELGSIIGKNSGGGLGSAAILDKFNRMMGETIEELDVFIKTLSSPKNKANLTALDKSLLAAARARKAHLDAIQEAARVQEENSEAVDENSNAHNRNTKAQAAASNALLKAGKAARDFTVNLAYGYIQIKAFHTAVSEAQQSFITGQPWDLMNDAYAAAMRGMDPQSMMAFQKEFRRASNAISGGVQEFNAQMFDNSEEMVRYTGSTKAGAEAMARITNTSHNIGLEFKDVSNAANGLFGEFKKLHNNVSMTAEEFTNMLGALAEDEAVKERLLTLQGKQRQAYVTSLVQQYHSLQLAGMQAEAAKKLVTHVNSLSNQKQVDKIVGSARESQYMQLLGLSSEVAEEYTRLRRNPGAHTQEEANRLIQITEEAARRRSEMMSTGSRDQREMMALQLQAVETNLGLEEFLKPLTDKILQSSAKANDATIIAHNERIQSEANHTLLRAKEELVQIHGILAGWSQTTLAQLVGAAVALALSKVAWDKLVALSRGLKNTIPERFLPNSGRPPANPNPGIPNPSPTPNPSPNGGQGKWRLPSASTGLKFLGAGAAFGLAGAGVDHFMGAEQSTEEGPRLIKEAVAQGLQGAGMASVVAPLAGPFAPLVVAAGGIVGSIKGAIDANIDYAKNFKNAATAFYDQTMSVQNAAMMKLDVEQSALRVQLKALQQKNDLTEAELRLVDQLKVKINGISESMSAEKLRYDVVAGQAAVGGASKWLDQRRGMTYKDTGDVTATLDRVQQMMNISGTRMDVANEFTEHLKAEFFKSDLQHDHKALTQLSEITEGLKNNKEVKIPREYSDMINKVMKDLNVTIKDQHTATMTDHLRSSLNSNPETISSVVKRQVEAVEEAKTNVAQLQQKINDLQAERDNNSTWMNRGTIDDQLEKLKEQLESAKRSERSAAETASFFRQTIEGEKSLQVRLSDEDRSILDKIASQPKKTQPFNS